MAGSGSDVRIPETPARRFRTSDRRTEGVTSVSFFGTDPDLNTPVVVKVLRPEAFPSPLERQRVVRELKRQVSVPHPSLARVIAADEEGGVVWVARDWIEGQPLSDRIARGTITPDEAARWTSQLAEALGELHRVMLLHRDVRPAHVILALDGRARLIDASCGRHFRGADGKPVFGTPGFVAPEAAAGKLVNARSDLYSLGATAFAMLQGSSPFGVGDDPALLERASRGDAPRATRGPEGVINAVASMLAREPRERPFHAHQIVQQLEPFFTAARVAAAADDSDGPPTAAVDEGMVSKALAIAAGPSILDDEFDDAEVTEVGRNQQDDSVKPVAAPTPKLPPPNVGSAAIRAPVASPNTGAHAVAVAPSSAPAMSMGQASQSVVRKATLMGMAPVPADMRPLPAPPVAAVAPAPSTDPAVREDSGSRSTGVSDFDEEENTVVSQDSRIFGHSQPHAQSAYGTAVPPLPDDVSKRVLQKGGNVTSPVEARPVSIPPPPSRKVTGSIRVPAPAGVPSLPHPDAAPHHAPLQQNGEATMTASVAAVVSASEQSGPNQALDEAASNVSITEPSGPSWDMHAQPMAVAPDPAQQYAHAAQSYGQQPGYPQQQQPGYPQQQQPGYPQQQQPGYPQQQQQAGYGAPNGAYPTHNPTGSYSAPPQQATSAYPLPPPHPTGAYPSPHPTGAYPSPHPTGAYNAPPNATAAWPQQPAKKSSLFPWIAAGCLIALVAGGTGYGLALRHRATAATELDAPPQQPVGQTPVDNAAQNAAQIAAQNAAQNAANNAAQNAANNAALLAAADAALVANPGVPTVDPTIANNAVTADAAVVAADPPQQAVADSGVPSALVAANTTPTHVEPAHNPANAQVAPTNNPVANNNSATRTVTTPAVQTPLQQARALNARRDYAGARAILESWVRSHPSDAQAFLLLGDVRFSLGERRPAGDAYRSAIAAGNYARPYWQRLVDRQMSIGDRTGAINTLNDVLRHRPGDRDATRKLAEIQGGGARPAAGSAVPAFGAPTRTVRR